MKVSRKPECLARLRGLVREILTEIGASAEDKGTLPDLLSEMLPPDGQKTSLPQYEAADLFLTRLREIVEQAEAADLDCLFQDMRLEGGKAWADSSNSG